jgi:hypothetical protein
MEEVRILEVFDNLEKRVVLIGEIRSSTVRVFFSGIYIARVAFSF